MHSYLLYLVRLFVLAVLPVAVAAAQKAPAAEEIPLERCDRLPVVRVRVDGVEKRFLVDTAATSMLNLSSFAQANSKEIRRAVSSWSGTTATAAREVALGELVLGSYRLRRFRLPAIDLSAIGKACGGRIDGILGVDLLEKMGASIDLKRRVAILPTEPAGSTGRTAHEDFYADDRICVEALNRSDLQSLEPCFVAQVVLFSPDFEAHGRGEVLDELRRRYFETDPPAQFDFRARDLRVVGDVAWHGYDYTIKLPAGRIEGRGTGMWRKIEGHWRMVFMHNALYPAERSSQP